MNQTVKKFNKEFEAIKRNIFIRDEWECKLPLETHPEKKHFGTLTIDHIIKRSLRGTNDRKYLITLCVGAHDYVDGLKKDEKINLLGGILNKLYGYEYPADN